MLLDRDTVLQLLDKKSPSYDGDILAIKLLPVESIFEITIEEIVTAEYYDEKTEELFRFKLDYDHLIYGKDIPESHIRNLDIDINNNLKELQSTINKERNISNNKLKWTIKGVTLIVLLFIFYYLFIMYKN